MKKLLLATLAGLMMLAPPALAGHGSAPITVHVTYESAHANQAIPWLAWTCPTGFVTGQVGEPECDPTGQTQDGSIDYGGYVWLPDGDTLEPGVDSVQASIVDDVNGANVQAGALCTDENGNNICGEEGEGEASTTFCGNSDVLELPPAPNFDAVAVFTGGGVRQVTYGCDPGAAPAATSGGVLNPAGGIFLTFG